MGQKFSAPVFTLREHLLRCPAEKRVLEADNEYISDADAAF